MRRMTGGTMAASVAVWMALAFLASAVPAAAADLKPHIAAAMPAMSPAFPRSERARAVWAASACFRDCGAFCAWGQTQCLERDSQGQCLKLTDDCDRYCQRSCRTSGGPLLPLDF